MRTKKFKTAQGFLQDSYEQFYDRKDMLEESTEAKIQRSKLAKRRAILALLSAINLNIGLDHDEDLRQAVERIQQMPEAQEPRLQHFLKGACQWLRRNQVLSVNVTTTRTTPVQL
jgi:hypothetical protein